MLSEVSVNHEFRGAHGWGANRRTLPRGKFSPIRPPPVKFMTAHKLRYSDSDFRLIISDSDFSSDILKEYVKKKPRVLEFNIEDRILNLCELSYLFKHRYF